MGLVPFHSVPVIKIQSFLKVFENVNNLNLKKTF